MTLPHFTQSTLENPAAAEDGLTAKQANKTGPNRLRSMQIKGGVKISPDSKPGRTAKYEITEEGRKILGGDTNPSLSVKNTD